MKVVRPTAIMADAPTTTPPGSPEPLPSTIIEGLTTLDRKWTEIRDTREHLDDPAPLTDEQLEAGRDILAQIATELVPSIQRHLEKLIKALGLGPFARDPKPQLRDVREIIAQLGLILDRTDNTIISLSPWTGTWTAPGTDQTYGVLKKFRCDTLFDLFRSILREGLHEVIVTCIEHIEYFRSGDLARHQAAITAYKEYDYRGSRPPTPQPHPAGEKMIELVGTCREELSRVIDICTRSDLALLQDGWRWIASTCDVWLAEIAERLRVIPDPPAEERPQRMDALEQPFGPPDHEHPPGFIRYHAVPLLRMSVPILKLFRIFLHKLLNKPRATPFRVTDYLSSVDLFRLANCLRYASQTVDLILTHLCWMYDDDTISEAAYRLLDKWPRDLTVQLDRVIVVLSLYHSPPTVESARTPLESIFKTMFYSLRGQLFLATRNFTAEAVRFNSLRNVANQVEVLEASDDDDPPEDIRIERPNPPVDAE
ncbi:hypothetical protein PCASD_14428 [Puccinia coronata f. sp. avenae]|uniref:Uncharacterized protein n=1 Tax=Puccinia coronata f. sp. avenae TaxID=200324 RepID=A0A2N5UDR2_9BASI|nr:hypothetical protein PCASD_14428 [Puccinia coronata f. sp. avenae]